MKTPSSYEPQTQDLSDNDLDALSGGCPACIAVGLAVGAMGVAAGVSAAKKMKIRIRLKAFDHRVIDESMRLGDGRGRDMRAPSNSTTSGTGNGTRGGR